MKIKMYKLLIAFIFSVLILPLTSCVQTYPVHPVYYDNYYNGYYYHGNCRWIPAHWRYGQFVPAQRICFGGGGVNCGWTYGFWRHGYYHEPHQVCFRHYY